MLALINTEAYEEVMEDLNNMCFSVIEPKATAREAYDILEAYATEGSTEEFLYRELDQLIEVAGRNYNKPFLLDLLGTSITNEELRQVESMSNKELQIAINQLNS